MIHFKEDVLYFTFGSQHFAFLHVGIKQDRMLCLSDVYNVMQVPMKKKQPDRAAFVIS